jgi:hypothetical protein
MEKLRAASEAQLQRHKQATQEKQQDEQKPLEPPKRVYTEAELEAMID